jgi:hypothetical protein
MTLNAGYAPALEGFKRVGGERGRSYQTFN